MIDELIALTNSQVMGCVRWDRKRDLLSFHYNPSWRQNPAAFPLSLSLPLASKDHEHAPVNAFLWGLLPDNDGVLQSWGQRFQVSPRNPFKLLSHVGEDCAGAVQLVRPDRADDCLKKAQSGRVKWLSQTDIAERLRLLIQDHSATRLSTDRGHFSLAGAQPKLAFHHDPKADRWGIPSGMVPTTHIFKPFTGSYDGYVENEHFCMALARALGMPVAASTVTYFNDLPVIVLERYDRLRQGRTVHRIHQEDMCQALARMPHQKYQNQGGPSAIEIMSIIHQRSTAREADGKRFLDALLLNWFWFGTDAHAKNYSLLIGAHGSVRLAPLYDLSSALPYPEQVYPRHATLAMRIGNQYKLLRIGSREWRKAATELRVDPDILRDRLQTLAQQIPTAARQVQRELKGLGIKHPVIARLVKTLTERAATAAAMPW